MENNLFVPLNAHRYTAFRKMNNVKGELSCIPDRAPYLCRNLFLSFIEIADVFEYYSENILSAKGFGKHTIL